MSVRTQALERERHMLVSRSSLARLRMRRDAHRLCRTLGLRPLVAAAARAPAIRGAALGISLSIFGARRVARAVAFASSILYLVRLVR